MNACLSLPCTTHPSLSSSLGPPTHTCSAVTSCYCCHLFFVVCSFVCVLIPLISNNRVRPSTNIQASATCSSSCFQPVPACTCSWSLFQSPGCSWPPPLAPTCTWVSVLVFRLFPCSCLVRHACSSSLSTNPPATTLRLSTTYTCTPAPVLHQPSTSPCSPGQTLALHQPDRECSKTPP